MKNSTLIIVLVCFGLSLLGGMLGGALVVNHTLQKQLEVQSEKAEDDAPTYNWLEVRAANEHEYKLMSAMYPDYPSVHELDMVWEIGYKKNPTLAEIDRYYDIKRRCKEHK